MELTIIKIKVHLNNNLNQSIFPSLFVCAKRKNITIIIEAELNEPELRLAEFISKLDSTAMFNNKLIIKYCWHAFGRISNIITNIAKIQDPISNTK